MDELKSVFFHIFEVGACGLIALGLLALAMYIDPSLHDALSTPVAQLLGTLIISLVPKAARATGTIGDYVNE